MCQQKGIEKRDGSWHLEAPTVFSRLREMRNFWGNSDRNTLLKLLKRYEFVHTMWMKIS